MEQKRQKIGFGGRQVLFDGKLKPKLVSSSFGFGQGSRHNAGFHILTLLIKEFKRREGSK